MAKIPITIVRYQEEQARKMLHDYIFGSPYSSSRPPRGIDPGLVARFLLEELKPDSPPRACERALEAMRFYEIHTLTAHLGKFLTGAEQTYNDIRRSAFLLRAIGDFGTAAELHWAADYFDRILLRKAMFAEVADLLLDTLLVLAPTASPHAFAGRLRAEAAAAPGSQTSRKLREIEDNRLPGFAYFAAGKQRLLDTPTDRRRWELVSIYLGQSDLNDPYLAVWAARLLRGEAMSGDPAPIYADFDRVIDAKATANRSDTEAPIVIVRAGQAILYLHGKLTSARRQLYDDSHPEQGHNFLWDDWNYPV